MCFHSGIFRQVNSAAIFQHQLVHFIQKFEQAIANGYIQCQRKSFHRKTNHRVLLAKYFEHCQKRSKTSFRNAVQNISQPFFLIQRQHKLVLHKSFAAIHLVPFIYHIQWIKEWFVWHHIVDFLLRVFEVKQKVENANTQLIQKDGRKIQGKTKQCFIHHFQWLLLLSRRKVAKLCMFAKHQNAASKTFPFFQTVNPCYAVRVILIFFKQPDDFIEVGGFNLLLPDVRSFNFLESKFYP
ncbi:YfmQ family protein [Phnomibacter sp. MR]|uniref:YfmQ family protein n=1 Tax=Phnomibacter sp. MR TaxID=3042318 RepID=UPI003A7F7815